MAVYVEITLTLFGFVGANERFFFYLVAYERVVVEIADFVRKPLVAVVFVLEQFAARKSARPTVFVVHVRVHAQLRGFVAARVATLHPLFAEILGNESAPRVHEKSAYAAVVHPFELFNQPFGFEFVVPTPKRNGAEIANVFGIRQVVYKFVYSFQCCCFLYVFAVIHRLIVPLKNE